MKDTKAEVEYKQKSQMDCRAANCAEGPQSRRSGPRGIGSDVLAFLVFFVGKFCVQSTPATVLWNA